MSHVKEALEIVVRWVNFKGTQSDMNFFNGFCSRIESEVINEPKQIDYMARKENRRFPIQDNGDMVNFKLENIKL